jgi:hypothetical protein
MLVDFLKGNHLGATTTLPWLWQIKGPACKETKGVPRVSQGGLQPQLGPEVGDPRSQRPSQVTPGTEHPSQQPGRPATGQPRAPAMGAGADQRRQAQEGQRSGFLGTEGARGVDAEAEQGLAGPAPMAPATLRRLGVQRPRGMVTAGWRRQRLKEVSFF